MLKLWFECEGDYKKNCIVETSDKEWHEDFCFPGIGLQIVVRVNAMEIARCK